MILFNFDFKNILSNTSINFSGKYGLDDRKIFLFIKRLIKKNLINDVTFLDLYKITNKELIICGTCVNTNSPVYFSFKTYPDMPIYLAIRISCSLPFIFQPVKFNNQIFIDGGLTDNFPIQLTNHNVKETISICTNTSNVCNIDGDCSDIQSLIDYFTTVMQCPLNFRINKKITKHKSNIILINTNIKDMVDFNINSIKKESLYKKGYDTALSFINNIFNNNLNIKQYSKDLLNKN